MLLRIFLIVTGVLTVLAFVPGVVTIGVYVTLGPGILFAPGMWLAAAPNLFILGLVAACGNRLFRFLSHIPRLIVTTFLVASVLLASAGLATRSNQALEQKWQRFTQDDHAWSSGPFTARRIAILTDAWTFDDKGGQCGEFCQRLLYSGTVNSVLIGFIQKQDKDMAPALIQPVTRFSIERRASCPKSALVSGWDGVSIQQRGAAGECVTGVPDDVSSSDAIITSITLKGDEASPMQPDRALAADAFEAHRTTVYAIRDGRPVELFRKTDLSGDFFPGLVALGAIPDGHAGFEVGLFRSQRFSPGAPRQLPALLWTETGFHPGPVTGVTRRP